MCRSRVGDDARRQGGTLITANAFFSFATHSQHVYGLFRIWMIWRVLRDATPLTIRRRGTPYTPLNCN